MLNGTMSTNIVVLVIFFFVLAIPFCFSSIALPGCQNRCGSLSIPYPFGVGLNCSLAPSFNVLCNNSLNPPKAFLTVYPYLGNLEIIGITESQLRIENPYLLSRECYNDSLGGYIGITFFGTQYTFSDDNWLIGLGCDDMVMRLDDTEPNAYTSGCISYCKDGTAGGAGVCADNIDGSFAGIGCCRLPVPRGSTSVVVQLNDLTGIWGSTKQLRCSLAFIQEKSRSLFSYPFSYLNYTTPFLTPDYEAGAWKTSLSRLVMRLDWRIGNKTCTQARRTPATFACRDNTVCVDFATNVSGYHCHCLPGYQGNPYLPGGCQDINECEESRINPCDPLAICNNTLGSFSCSCQEGYKGDGRKGRRGCVRIPRPNTLVNVLTGLGSGLGFIIVLAMCVWLNKTWQKRKKQMLKDKFFKRNGGLLLQQQTNEGALGRTKVFSAQDLETATDHFNESRILGKGGQGTVYKGMLSDGKIVAVKKSMVVDDNLLEQFINEVVILSQINHRNVVKLLGCCLETDVPLLVYEFLPNGTLFDHIHDPAAGDTGPLASWNMRLKIATDMAGALAYIHSASSVPIYHRDIKSQNFLLDEKYIVKLADFGISRSIEVNQTHLTTMVRGTFGYLDPEYFHTHQYSEKSEVYSFGVVLSELLTSKKPVFWESEERLGLAAHFLECAEENRLVEVIDPKILEYGGKEEVISAVARLAQRCLNPKGKMRPTMKEVATELESLSISQMPPSTIIQQSCEARGYDANSMMFPDMDETWTTSNTTETPAPTYTHTFMIEEHQ